MILPDYVLKAIEYLEKNGYEAVVVGGAVRDYLLNKTPDDYDISTNAKPEEVKKVFEDYYTLDTGIKHGTITVFMNHHQIEITTYRSENQYEDYRHPNQVVFVPDLETDLKRRDFTINSICYNRNIIDLVDGIADLKNGIVRAIGDPKTRFNEDPLRILRALRFSATLDFIIEDDTKKAMFNQKKLIEKVSQERIQIEMNKLILGNRAHMVINEFFEIIEEIIPELKLVDKDNITFHLQICDFDLFRRLASLFYQLEVHTVFLIMKRMKYSKKMIKGTLFYLENKDNLLESEKNVINALSNYSYTELKNLIKFQKVFYGNEIINNCEQLLTRIYREKRYFRLKDLKITGTDLLELGFVEGIKIRIILDTLLKEVISNELKNTKEDLLKRALDYKNIL